MQQKRKQRETEFEQKQQGKEKQRLEAARAKELEREERIAALNKQQQDHIQELQKKILQKVCNIIHITYWYRPISQTSGICYFSELFLSLT